MINRRSFIGLGTLAASLLLEDRLAASLAKQAKGRPGATVETTAGKVQGISQGGVHAFRGIRYGASTAGAARFLPPAKPLAWTGTRDAFELGLRSPQPDAALIPEVTAVDRSEPIGEDCLCLNVWSQGLRDGHNRPVMVWLHGGGYSTGSAGFTIYDGANLAHKRDVVVVGVNHRLNIFGFLYLADLGNAKYEQASNVGMLDIVAALEWVRDNIAAFGGNPGNVTIFGQSGGGGKVSTLMAMPRAKGLFHRAIVESASAIKGVPRAAATSSTETILGKLGLDKAKLDELQTLPMEKLLTIVSGGGPAGRQELLLAPVVDGHSLPTDPFYPKAPAISADVPLLIGMTATEVTFIPNTPLDTPNDALLHERVKQTVRVDDAKASRLIEVYREGQPHGTNRDIFLSIATDNWMLVNVNTEAERKAALGKAPTYMYNFTWRSPVRDGKLGAFHTLEIPFVFENVDIGKSMTGEAQNRYALADKLSGAWVAFARTGNPNHTGLPNWPSFTETERATMILNDECELANDPRREERLAIAAAKASAT
jgi:para-nitrobenzyl esterase